MLNWIVWNRTVYLYKMDLALNNLQRLICHKTQINTHSEKIPSVGTRENFLLNFKSYKCRASCIFEEIWMRPWLLDITHVFSPCISAPNLLHLPQNINVINMNNDIIYYLHMNDNLNDLGWKAEEQFELSSENLTTWFKKKSLYNLQGNFNVF